MMNSENLLVIVGLFRSGTSCVAGSLHKLGISMGREFKMPSAVNLKGSFEDQRFALLCQSAFPEPEMERAKPAATIEAEITAYLNSRQENTNTYWGVKHPGSCMLVKELGSVCPQAKYLVVRRPLAESWNSIRTLDWGFKRDTLEMMASSRDQFAKSGDFDVEVVEFHQLLQQPQLCLQRIVEWLELEEAPTAIQWQEAISFVDRKVPRWVNGNTPTI